MSDRNPCRGGYGGDRGDSGHDFGRDPGFAQCKRLLAAASEDERVTALQADDVEACSSGFDEPRVYELQPLRRADVVAAAAEADVEELVAAVVDRGVGPLARVPLTLRFLLDSYARDGQLPTRRAELYRDGCRELCREQNPSRVETDRAGTMSAEQRLALAERIAAGTVLAGRAAVRVRGAGRDPTVVELRELDGGSERTSDDLVAVASDVEVDQERLGEALIHLVIWFEGEPCGGRDRDATMQALAERARELEDQHAVYLRVVSLNVRRP